MPMAQMSPSQIEGFIHPKDWTDDKERRQEAGIPDDVTFKTKAQLGLEMILDVRNRGVCFGWVGMDARYGEQPWLRNRLDDEGITYMADIPTMHRIFPDRPKILVPKRKDNRGRKPTKLKPDTLPLNVKAFVETQGERTHAYHSRCQMDPEEDTSSTGNYLRGNSKDHLKTT